MDGRGRVSVARFGFKATQLLVEELPDGGLVMHEAVALTAAEAAHLRNPNAVAQLDRGLEDVQEGRVRRITLRSKR